MAAVKAPNKVPRGAAAVEFAIVAPLLLLLLLGMCYFGLALITRLQLGGVASTTARQCTAMQNTGDSPGTLQQCATTQFQTLLLLNPTGCKAPTVSPVVTYPTVNQSLKNGSQRLALLTVQVTCDFNVNPLKAFSQGIVPGSIKLNVSTAMPFVIGNR